MNVFISKVSCLLLGCAYPAYASYQCIELNIDNVDVYNWQIYWIVFSFFKCAECIADIILCWLPFYYELKFMFVLWLLPTFGSGCLKVYQDYLEPFVETNKLIIEYEFKNWCIKFFNGFKLLVQLLVKLIVSWATGVPNRVFTKSAEQKLSRIFHTAIDELLHKFGFRSTGSRGLTNLPQSSDEVDSDTDAVSSENNCIESYQQLYIDPLQQLDLIMYNRCGRTFDGCCAAKQLITEPIIDNLLNELTKDAQVFETIEFLIRQRPNSVVVPADSESEG